MKSKAKTPKAYVDGLPPGRREAVAKVRAVILKNLPKGYEETVDFGLLAYVVPLKRYPDTYNGHPLMVAALASQKQYMSVYLMCVYADKATATWFKAEYRKRGKKLDMSCRVLGCKNRSGGPRNGFMCEEHAKLPKKQQQAARDAWKRA